MAVLNVTPDSFSGDGLLGNEAALLSLARADMEAGADILDIGGESTRPGAVEITADEELARVLPLVRALAGQVDAPLSIDTRKPAVADAALAAGATILNDISGLAEPELADVAARHGAWLVLMHNRLHARPKRDALGGFYPDVAGATDIVDEVARHLLALTDEAQRRGVPTERLIVDPGLGFGKTPRESLELLRRTAELRERLAPFPLLVGASRKSFVGRALGLPVEQRLEGTLACVAIAVFAGVHVIRVHDVQPAVRATRMAWAVRQGLHAEIVSPV
jgi:dihydropteroate synthase